MYLKIKFITGERNLVSFRSAIHHYNDRLGEPSIIKQTFLAHADDIEIISRRKGLLNLLDAVRHGDFPIIRMRSPGKETGAYDVCVPREELVEHYEPAPAM